MYWMTLVFQFLEIFNRVEGGRHWENLNSIPFQFCYFLYALLSKPKSDKIRLFGKNEGYLKNKTLSQIHLQNIACVMDLEVLLAK